MRKLHTVAVLFAVLLCLPSGGGAQGACQPDAVNPPSRYSTVTQQLVDMADHNAELGTLLRKSIAEAARINPDRRTNPAQTLEEFYAFVERATRSMPWSVLPENPECGLYERIDQGLDYIYFISDIPLPELAGRGYYNNSIQYMEPYRSWLVSYAKAWGAFLDTEKSWNDCYYRMALADARFGLGKGWYESPSNWKTFNQFFARRLASPTMRPIAEPDNEAVVTAAADSKPQGVWMIDASSKIVLDEGVRIKSRDFHSVVDLIGPGSAYGDSFAGGTLTHAFLDVNDYHRYHFPVSGTIREMRLITADDAAGGIQTWDAQKGKYVLDAQEPGWQSIETRGCLVVETDDYGLVALLPVGMSQVSSVNFEPNLREGDRVKKGDPLGYFLFGGSDFVFVFQRGVMFEMTAPRSEAAGEYEHILMGEEYGKLTGIR